MIDEISELKLIEKEDEVQIEDDHWFKKVLKLTISFAVLFGALLWLASCSLNPSPCWHTDDTNDCNILNLA